MLRFLSLIITSLLFFLSSCSVFSPKKPPLVFDAEMSGNDLMSLYILSRTGAVSLIAVTPSGTDLKTFTHAAEDAARVLTLAEQTNVPVSSVLSRGLCTPATYPPGWITVNEDTSGYNLPPSTITPLPITGSALMKQVISQSKQKVILLCLGPLNNLANVLVEAPELKEKIARVIMLGGSLHTTENVALPFHLQWKETSIYNTFADPCSANVVLTSGIPITLIPLDVVSLVRNTPDLLEKYNLAPPTNPGARFVLKVLSDHAQSNTIRSFAVFWDMVGIMSIIHPKLLKFETMTITVVTQPGQALGHIIPVANGTSVQLCTWINSQAFFDLFFKMINE